MKLRLIADPSEAEIEFTDETIRLENSVFPNLLCLRCIQYPGGEKEPAGTRNKRSVMPSKREPVVLAASLTFELLMRNAKT